MEMGVALGSTVEIEQGMGIESSLELRLGPEKELRLKLGLLSRCLNWSLNKVWG